MANPIRFKKGTKTNLPTLAQGEPGYCTDSDEMFVGDGSVNHPMNTQTPMFVLIDADTAQEADTSIGGDWRILAACTVIEVGAYCLGTAPDGAGTIIDIHEGGITILSTKITIDTGEKSSKDAAAQPVISDSAIAAGAVITFDIDGVAATTPGKGLVVWMKVVY